MKNSLLSRKLLCECGKNMFFYTNQVKGDEKGNVGCSL